MARNFFDEGSPYLQHPLLTVERTTGEVDALEELLGVGPGAALLDVGCGFGRHSIEFARRGYRVTGIDPSPTMIDAATLAAERSASAGSLDVDFLVARAEAVELPGRRFAGAVCLFTTLGQVGPSGDDNRALLANVATMLEPGARLIVEVPQQAAAVAGLVESDIFDRPDGKTEISRRYDPATGRVSETFVLSDHDGRQRRFELEYRLYSAAELTGLLAEAGFTEVGLAGSLTDAIVGVPLSDDGPSMIAVAGKR